ncbi:hypothetical protein [Psychrobium sp. 1_MG-2023]|uniref:hypothetical protein n=1 Tax=Psychrobium sp. 1_MG-2023 TaxID=3062624 RepID=UPI000C34A6F1|nr:hypothetical protein [Psychrobium sp. 1_MG-2023]MDP2561403.1 hypothetical protein [Psychrobium sp. 1_MG-2023]PKF54882.1 hypothetical protein CW748_15150 [Alteromonadales bacterium alter-6D02]
MCAISQWVFVQNLAGYCHFFSSANSNATPFSYAAYSQLVDWSGRHIRVKSSDVVVGELAGHFNKGL